MIPRRRSLSLCVVLLVAIVLALLSLIGAGAALPVSDELAALPSPRWSTTVLREGKVFAREGDHYLRVDASGRAHLAYGGDHLYYATQEVDGWHCEVVDSTPSSDASLALDSGGQPVIAYYDRWNADLKLARRSAQGWLLEVIDAGGDVGSSAALALAPAGQTYVAYLDATSGAVKVAWRDGANWRSSLVDRARVVRQRTSLALAPSGQPQVAYFDDLDQLRHASLDGAAWRLSPSVAGVTRDDVSLAVRTDGRPSLLYAADYGGLIYAELEGNGWASTVVNEAARFDSVSLLLDANGEPIFTVASPRRMDEYDQTLVAADAFVWHGGRANGAWWLEAVEAGGRASDLAVDASGRAWIAYFRAEETLELAQAGPLGGWVTEVVDHEAPLSGPVRLALDGGAKAHLTYATGASTRHLWQTGEGWQSEDLPITDPVTLRAFGVDSLGQPRFVTLVSRVQYYPPEWFDSVSLYERQGSEWQGRLLESNWGASPALAVDGQDRSHVAFAYNSIPYGPPYVPEHELRYLGPSHGEVTTIGGADSGVSIIADAAGHPHISSVRYHEPWHEINYRFHDGSSWRAETVVEGDPAIQRVTEIQLDAQGDPAILYWLDDDIMLARRKTGQWKSQLVIPGVGVTGALAFDLDGRPRIVFWRDGLLKHAVEDAGMWSTSTIAPAPRGAAASFAIAPGGELLVAYFEPLSNQLRFAAAPAHGAAVYLPLVIR